jgi:adenylate cyclase
MSELVFSHQGSIDKFLGDCLMAVFGPPITSSLDVTNAAMCALEIVERISQWNDQNTLSMPVRVAIGIHYGDVVQGDIGSDKRLDFTVIGDTVNLASRVEAYCRTLNATVLVTDALMEALLSEGNIETAKSFTDEGTHYCADTESLFMYTA